MVGRVDAVASAALRAGPGAHQASFLYDDDERVIALITRGIGQPEIAAVVEERCTCLEVAEDLR